MLDLWTNAVEEKENREKKIALAREMEEKRQQDFLSHRTVHPTRRPQSALYQLPPLIPLWQQEEEDIPVQTTHSPVSDQDNHSSLTDLNLELVPPIQLRKRYKFKRDKEWEIRQNQDMQDQNGNKRN